MGHTTAVGLPPTSRQLNMPFSALVLTLGPDPASVVTRLSNRSDLLLGELTGTRLPVVLESIDASSAARVMDALSGEPGVLHVDLITAHYEEDL